MRKLVIIAIILGIIELCIALYLTEWRHVFWDSINEKNSSVFIIQLEYFTIAALGLCFVSSYASYLETRAAIKWRSKLNEKALQVTHQAENLNQRIQDDCNKYPALMITTIFGLFRAFIYILVFAVALSYNFSWKYLIFILIYTIIGTLLTKSIAKPLISLNYKSQVAEATYRNDLSTNNFSKCMALMFGIASKTKHLNYFQIFFGQLAVIIPLVILAPSYFTSAITFGALMQANSIMGTIIENMSYGIVNFGQITNLLSCKSRLKEIGVI